MFTISRTRFGVTYPLPIIYINDAALVHNEADVTIESVGDGILDILGVEYSAKFIEDVTLTEFSFPLQGDDFSTKRDGSLEITITETLPEGLYTAPFINTLTLPGIYGFGLSGMFLGGNTVTYTSKLPIFLQIQSLVDDWQEAVVEAAQPYIVETVIRL